MAGEAMPSCCSWPARRRLSPAWARAIATLAMRFILLLIITIAVAEVAPDCAGHLLLMAAGALWASVVGLILGALARAERSTRFRGNCAAAIDGVTAADALAAIAGAPVRLAVRAQAYALPRHCRPAALAVARSPSALDRAHRRVAGGMADRCVPSQDDATCARRGGWRAG
jgi:hypothetical protein